MIFHHSGASIRSAHDSVTIGAGVKSARRGSMGSSSHTRALAGAQAQSLDCNRLQGQIAQASAADPATARFAAAAQKQRSELDRTVAYAHSIGCDRSGFVFFGPQPPAQCPAINAQIQRMRANLDQVQGQMRGGAAQTLVAQYNAYCRG